MKHSQHDIESYLEKYLPHPGTFLEIGAWDGELISQTAWLEREKNWRGLCVDPFPNNFDRRACRLAPVAISRDGRPRKFVRVFYDRRDHGDVSYFSGFQDTLVTHWPLIRDHCDYQVIDVQTVTMADLYRRYDLPDHIDFLSVDTEGSELEIFESIRWDAWSYGLIVFEHNESEEVRQKVGAILDAAGYDLVAALRCDDIYLNRSLRTA